MKPTACLLVLAASLGATSSALAQSGTSRPAVVPGRVQLLGADMAATCKTGDIARAHRLADACEGKRQCSFTPEAGDAAAEACARDSMALWDCGDGKTRYAPLAPQGANQSREIRLECAPDAAATATPATNPPAATQTAAQDKTETVKVDGAKLPAIKIVVKPPAATGLDVSAAGVDREMKRANDNLWYDPRIGSSGAGMMAGIHGSLYDRPGHSPNAVADKCAQSGQSCAGTEGTAVPLP